MTEGKMGKEGNGVLGRGGQGEDAAEQSVPTQQSEPELPPESRLTLFPPPDIKHLLHIENGDVVVCISVCSGLPVKKLLLAART